MKIKVLLLTVSTLTLSLGSCNTPKKPDAPFSFDRINYTLKPGVSEDELQGAPWINSNLPGMTAKVERPSLKDDFYASVNYEELCNNEPGPFDISTDNVRSQLYSIVYEETSAANSKFIRKAKSLINNGAVPQIQLLLNSISIEEYIYSSDLFKTVGSFFSLRSIGPHQYVLDYNDGYLQGQANFATLEFMSESQYTTSSYRTYYRTIRDGVLDSLLNTFGITMSDAVRSNAISFDASLSDEIYARAFPAPNYQYRVTYTTYTLSSLSSSTYSDFVPALSNLGLSSGDEIRVSNLTDYGYSTIKSLLNSNPTVLKSVATIRALFDYRFLAGLEGYKAISHYVEDSQFFANEYDLRYYNNEAASYYMLRAFIPDLIQKSYTELYASSETKQRVAELIEDVLDGYYELAESINWISDYTRDGMKRKVEYMTYSSCYSDFINNYPAIDETGVDLFDLIDIHNKYYEMEYTAILNNAHEDNEYWQYMPAFTVNAFYNPAGNTFVILNGLLSGGFLGDSIEETYGKLGVVIGHEISHGFDENGAKYDEYGRESNWWLSADKTTFKTKIKKVKKFLNSINLYDDVYVNGVLTNTEATADMGGVRVMLLLAKKIRNFDYDKFFKSYAKLWLERWYDDYTIERMLTNEHPYAYIRVNATLAQFDEFVRTYHIKSGDGMYVPKNERIAVW